jgi:hypothetical protein
MSRIAVVYGSFGRMVGGRHELALEPAVYVLLRRSEDHEACQARVPQEPGSQRSSQRGRSSGILAAFPTSSTMTDTPWQ